MTNKSAVVANAYPGLYQPPTGRPCWHTIRDAAEATRASEGAIRYAARAAGVVHVSGRTVRGMVEISVGGRVGYVPYSR
jgi:hypothetical protein